MQYETAFAKQLRTEHGLSLGCFGETHLAPNGKPYVVLSGPGAEPEAAKAFAEYVAGRKGVLHWRTQPECFRSEGFWMRLLLETAEGE
jgi:hypothetical protein